MSSNDEQEAALLALPAAEFGAETRRRALDAYDERDWHAIYGWTKAWISRGGGAWTIDAWLLYVISALLHGQPRIAVRSVDLALGTWIEAPEDRAILRWVRAAVIHQRLKDPKTAEADYRGAATNAPARLSERIQEDTTRCAADAAVSRKRKPSVTAAPEFRPRDRGFVTGPQDVREPGSMPTVWPQMLETLSDSDPAAS